ncbi:MAG: polysaccharide biosynthesis/export family protein [Pseudomonadota bacterium]
MAGQHPTQDAARPTQLVVAAFCLLISLAPARAVSQPASYLVNPGDRLQIDVWNEESLSRNVLVRPDGIISLPMAGDIPTSGLAPGAVAVRIADALGDFMKDRPRVVVSLVEAAGNQIYVLGKVDKPGRFRISANTDVMQALALAGGLNSFADEDDIKVLRRNENGQQTAIPFRYSQVKSGKSLESNIVLRSGDLVVVP